MPKKTPGCTLKRARKRTVRDRNIWWQLGSARLADKYNLIVHNHCCPHLLPEQDSAAVSVVTR